MLSITSYYLIEKPFRNKEYKFKKILILVTLTIFFLTLFTSLTIIENGFKKRVPNMFRTTLEQKIENYYQNGKSQKIVLIGDSHADALSFSLNEKIKKNNLSLFRFDTRMYIKNFKQVNDRDNNEFLKNNQNIDKFLQNNSNLIIIFHQRWTEQIGRMYFYNNNQIENSSNSKHNDNVRIGLKSQINEIIKLGHKLILVYPVPEMSFIPKRLLYRKYLFEGKFDYNSISILSESYEKFKLRNELIFEILDSIQSHNIYRVYPHKFFVINKLKINV
jgi:hypothetical protein